MLPELVGFARSVVTVEPFAGFDVYGERTYGAAVTHRARVAGRRRLLRRASGEEVVSTHAVYFAASPRIGPHDRVTLSTGDVNSTEAGARQPELLDVGTYPDDLGRVHVTAYLA